MNFMPQGAVVTCLQCFIAWNNIYASKVKKKYCVCWYRFFQSISKFEIGRSVVFVMVLFQPKVGLCNRREVSSAWCKDYKIVMFFSSTLHLCRYLIWYISSGVGSGQWSMLNCNFVPAENLTISIETFSFLVAFIYYS